ncbi:MAG: Tim44/TimA family putative adaptor protein [Alphaproteobacteria bacterium]
MPAAAGNAAKMGEGFQFLDILVFAAVAAFLVYRLKNTLGKRTGNERPPREAFPPPAAGKTPASNDKVVRLPGIGQKPADAPFEQGEQPAEAGQGTLAGGLTQIQLADRNFDPQGFAEGARAAFEIIVTAFAAGDTKTLKPLLSDEVMQNFGEAIRQRQAAKETLETTLVGIKTAEITDARLDGRTAYVTVRFVSEQVNVTRNAEAQVVSGDPTQVTNVTDIWTFSRDTRSRDPNWALVATDNAA